MSEITTEKIEISLNYNEQGQSVIDVSFGGEDAEYIDMTRLLTNLGMLEYAKKFMLQTINTIPYQEPEQ